MSNLVVPSGRDGVDLNSAGTTAELKGITRTPDIARVESDKRRWAHIASAVACVTVAQAEEGEG